MSPPLFERLAADPRADIGDDPPGARDVEAAVAALGRATGGAEPDASLAAFDEAGRLHDLDTLDAILASAAGGGLFSFLRGGRRRRLRNVARHALARTSISGSLRLAAALLGSVGGREDVERLETVAAHPSFTFHGATALGNMTSREALGALLRLLGRTDGDARILVIDCLLAHVREPAVRLALVRDALIGLSDAEAREIAAAIAEAVDVRALAADAGAPDDLRTGAARLLALAARPPAPDADL